MPPDGTPDVLTIPEAARRLRVGRNSAYEAAQRGELPVLRIGRRLLVPRVALERLLAGNGADSRNADAAGSAGRGVHSKETTCASDDSPRPAARQAAPIVPHRRRVRDPERAPHV